MDSIKLHATQSCSDSFGERGTQSASARGAGESQPRGRHVGSVAVRLSYDLLAEWRRVATVRVTRQ